MVCRRVWIPSHPRTASSPPTRGMPCRAAARLRKPAPPASPSWPGLLLAFVALLHLLARLVAQLAPLGFLRGIQQIFNLRIERLCVALGSAHQLAFAGARRRHVELRARLLQLLLALAQQRRELCFLFWREVKPVA